MILLIAAALAAPAPAAAASCPDVVTAQAFVCRALEAQKDGVAPTVGHDELRRRITKTQWTPGYSEL